MKLDLPKDITKEQKQQYIDICYKIWGVIPVDYTWAITTGSYKEQLKKLTHE
jgi:hypothetical protein